MDKLFLFFLLILPLTFQCAFALPQDREKVMELSADTADLNEQTHRGEYVGDVELDQGTTHLRASKAVTEGNQKNKLVVAIAWGDKINQAHYWTQTATDKPLLHAFADTIRYYPDRHLIELIGNARVEQGDNSFSAAKISYDTLKQHVLSKSDGKTRTMIVIHPDKQTGKKA
ncbi:lipopolysaccharide transport periplasmic protein LptA [Legionella spiritensis]|uniref:lipopolysaccharide transport periplasmic protein LptA n=1 Tax=Legionella spiritensis TaxID=452 RepID=UPI000F6D40BC|nr:lipopolysaccharide transport periplasmic protein LptA [Legionella spiritensis]VEG89708.1 OstA family protein [Legionella spiritensis]